MARDFQVGVQAGNGVGSFLLAARAQDGVIRQNPFTDSIQSACATRFPDDDSEKGTETGRENYRQLDCKFAAIRAKGFRPFVSKYFPPVHHVCEIAYSCKLI
jgi:hypothetical protein